MRFSPERLDAGVVPYLPPSFDLVWVRDFYGRLPADWPTSYVRNRDSVLLHELVHALRFLRAAWSPSRLGDGWRTTEEFLATMVANVYPSGRRAPLAGEYVRHARVADADDLARWAGAPPFRDALARFTRQMPDLALRLAAIDTPGNVFRVHLGAARPPGR